MLNNKINVFWFKRDLRILDNLPLFEASETDAKLLLIYVIEDSLLNDKHYSDIHWDFIKQSIDDINKSLGKKSILFVRSDVISALKKINKKFKIQSIYSHQETGIDITYQRDKKVSKYCKENAINWFEYEKNYVKRGLKNRKKWIEGWNEYVRSPIVNIELDRLDLIDPNEFKDEFILLSTNTIKNKNIQPGGTSNALKYLETFSDNRIKNYNKNISKPQESRFSCSRLSPYISWGNLSSRYIWQKLKKSINHGNSKFQVNSFLSRLRWNSHFIQRFEMESSIEFSSVNRGYQMIKKKINDSYYNAWTDGETGFPLVDASIKCLKATGYLNFRMRSMIVSFFTHHLWQPWQLSSHFLARNFLDFEPGIHYSQLQMQAGETGVNTIRIYNPTKNAIEKDKEAIFIKKWIPELKNIPKPLVFEPWKMSEVEQKLFNCEIGKNYPSPIVDIAVTRKYALDKLWGMRRNIEVKVDKKRILSRHINS